MKRMRKRLFATVLTLIMCIGLCIPDVSAATSTAKYDGGYGIDDILSQFQFFVTDDVSLDNSGHTVGSIVVGGNLEMANTFGDAGIVPSYIQNHISGTLGTGWHGKIPVKSNVVYYANSDAEITDSSWFENPDYFDKNWTTIADDLKAESLALSKLSVAESLNIEVGEYDGSQNITIDLTGETQDKIFTMSYDDFASASNIIIKVPDIDWFNKHVCVISVVDADGNPIEFDGFAKIKINNTVLETALETMTGADDEYMKQLNFSGMNLVWNFPDATGTINAQGIGGHFVAPMATVNLISGNYEGGIIAKNITGSAQGHFYPMNKSLPDADNVTADGTFSKKAVSVDGNELPGAKLTLSYVSGIYNLGNVKTTTANVTLTYDENTNEISWTSTSTPVDLTELPKGEYILSETSAPEGYQYAADIAFKVDSDGKIYQKNANGTYKTDSTLTITLVDEAKEGSITINGTKKITGNAPDEEYSFVIEDENGDTVATASVIGAGNFSFSAISYTKDDIGEHTYTVKEIAGNTPYMIYDSTEKTLVINVEDDGSKNSELKVTVSNESNVIEFNNTYSGGTTPDPVYADLTINKKAVSVDGEEISGASMKLSYVSGSYNLSDVETVGGTSVSKSGKAILWVSDATAPMQLSKLPIGEYILSETDAPDGYQYATDIAFKVGADGNVYQKKNDDTYNTEPTLTITMVDKAKTGSIVLKGTKNVTGDKTTETFMFVVDENGTQVSTGKVTGAGTITFNEIKYGPEDVGKIHTYKISEQAGNTPGMTYDQSVKTVKVKVTDNGSKTSSKLTVSLLSDSDSIVFNNKYSMSQGANAIFSKKAVSADGKELNDAELKLEYLSGDSDLRHVTPVKGPGITIENNNKVIKWVSTTTPLELVKLPDGEYRLTETSAPKGYKYATAIEFRVVDGKVYQKLDDGNYSTTTDPKLTMIDEAKAGSITINGKKFVEGNAPSDEVYEFVLKEGNKQIATSSVTGEGTFTFDINYGPEDIGTHNYTVTEIAGDNDHIVYDTTAITIKVEVTETTDTTDTLTATLLNDSEDIKFTNKYQEEIVVPTGADATFSKKAVSADGDELAGATIKLTYTGTSDLSGVTWVKGPKFTLSDNGKEITWVSTTTPLELSGLPNGAYVMEETAAPDGYEYAADINFKVENGKIYQQLMNGNYSVSPNPVLTMVDEAKDDSTTEDKPGTTEDDSTTEDKPRTAEDDSTTEDKPGTTEDDKTPKGNLIITVYDEETGDVVPGATVNVVDPDGNSTGYVTGEDGKIRLPDIDPGDYRIKTIKVPDGYHVTVGETEKTTVKPNETTEHDIYIAIMSSDSEVNPTPTTTASTPNTSTTSTLTNTSTSDNSVGTGDSFNPILFIAIIILSGMGIGILIYSKIKKENN